jgi:K+/H+ antiporter YhaU regulatory subunit KhtT
MKKELSGESIGNSRLRSKTGATVAAVWNEDGTLIVGDATKPHVLLKVRIEDAETLIT